MSPPRGRRHQDLPGADPDAHGTLNSLAGGLPGAIWRTDHFVSSRGVTGRRREFRQLVSRAKPQSL